MSEWLLINANTAIVQLCHGENNLIINEMMVAKLVLWAQKRLHI
jgi:hypothetical protein